MSLYLTLKLVHVLSATVLFGTGLGTAFQMWRADASGDVRAVAVVARNVVRADWVFTTPAVVVQPLTGLWMMHLAGWPLDTPWIMASLVLYGLVGCCWIPVVFIQMRVARITADCVRNGQLPGVSYRRLMRWWYTLGWPAFLAVLAIFWLMYLKPPLW